MWGVRKVGRVRVRKGLWWGGVRKGLWWGGVGKGEVAYAAGLSIGKRGSLGEPSCAEKEIITSETMVVKAPPTGRCCGVTRLCLESISWIMTSASFCSLSTSEATCLMNGSYSRSRS